MEAPDWSTLPVPEDDGAADHLIGARLPSVQLQSTMGGTVDPSALTGVTVIYVYPKSAKPGTDMPQGWDAIPGARGCTPQACAFRDHLAELQALGVGNLFGLSTQATDWQAELAERVHLPFPLLSDADLSFADGLNLPRFVAGGETLLTRLTIIARGDEILDAIYPIFPPDANAGQVIDWLRANAL